MNCLHREEGSVHCDLSRVSAFGLALALATPHTIAAQSVTFRLGGFRTFYADSLDVTAGSVAVDASWSTRRNRLGLGGSLASFRSDGWAAQGAANWAYVLTTDRARGLFASADANGYGFDGGAWAGTSTAGLVGAAPLGPALASLAASAGAVRRLDGTDDVLAQTTARLRSERGSMALDAWASAAVAGIQQYGDLAAAVRADWSWLTLDLTGGGRFGDLGDVAWAQARAAVRVAGPAWLEMSIGRYPPDVTGFAYGTFVQAGLRASMGRSPGQPGRATERAVVVEHEGDGTVALTFRVSGREPSEIAGDWNGWSPQPLQRLGGGLWRVRLTLEPGLHRFTLLDRGGAPFVPDGIPSEPDEFGARTGLLSVPVR